MLWGHIKTQCSRADTAQHCQKQTSSAFRDYTLHLHHHAAVTAFVVQMKWLKITLQFCECLSIYITIYVCVMCRCTAFQIIKLVWSAFTEKHIRRIDVLYESVMCRDISAVPLYQDYGHLVWSIPINTQTHVTQLSSQRAWTVKCSYVHVL